MPNVVVELQDGSLGAFELQTPPQKTAAKVLDACSRKFNKGVGSLSPKDNPSFWRTMGLRGADAAPKDEAQLARAAHGCLHGLEALHKVTLWVCVCNLHRSMPFTSTAKSLTVNLSKQLHQLCETYSPDANLVLRQCTMHLRLGPGTYCFDRR